MQGGGQPSNSKGDSQGAPQQGSEREQARENTPEKPGEKPGGKKPQDQLSQSGDPKSPKESDDEPENRAGGPPPKAETATASGDRSNESWGDLPPTVRDLFRTEGGSDLPPQYRDWIDAYYRRLNREPK
jgi:hypothetical protein